ncbi:MAG: VCBS repeat-containing protein [Fluviicola sp.]|nr:VCBS repeat-containing protein [Fluviicola sp.]
MKLFLSILFLVSFSTVKAQQFIDVASTNGIQKFYGSPSLFGGGVSFCDFNGDGLDDLSFASAAGDSLSFYQNNGNGFTKMDFGISDTNEVKQINWVDVDND